MIILLEQEHIIGFLGRVSPMRKNNGPSPSGGAIGTQSVALITYMYCSSSVDSC